MSNVDALQPEWPHRLPPALTALAAHVPALAVGAFLLAVGAPLSLAVPTVGLCAGGVAWLWNLPLWWRLINLLFVPCLWLALQFEIEAGWYLTGFVLLVLTSPGAVGTRVPLFLSSPQAARALADRLPPNAVFLDLGCGLGGPLARLARLRPDVRLHGVEAAPLNWLIARLRLGSRARVHLGSLWDADLSGFDAVYAYLSPAPMARLWQKTRAEMKSGSLLISNSFPVPDVPPAEIVELQDLSGARLLIWRL
jgi:hypothetical protein